ncbi:type IV-A pilus assembly ATPase PilB [Moraxella oculi]|uniref:Type IV-A pilus assembly ATPase PilB n=1 Tax=Moraxella oculi TaxID=2940516 RepID=A0ABW8UC28_9GAMM
MNASFTTNLGILLVEKKLLSQKQLDEILANMAHMQVSLAKYLVAHDHLPSTTIAQTLAEALGEKLVDLDKINLNDLPKLIDPLALARHEVLILAQKEGQVFIATSDPTRRQMLGEIAFATGLHATPVLVDEAKLAGTMQRLNLHMPHAFDDDGDDETIAFETSDDMLDAPTVKFVHTILSDAINMGVSDIHFEPFRQYHRVRFRIDGLMQTIATPPKTSGNKINTRLKVMARLDIAERRKPQDGRIKFLQHQNSKKSVDFRVSTTPTIHGEKIVLRLLDVNQALISVDALGMNTTQQQTFLNALNKSQGMILITGPTGSGKTISLYTGLSILNRPDINIQTVEDPVEIELDGINQVNIHPKIGLDFADVLRAFLRQDPDVIMVGEIRDAETAQIAIKAAQTGHLVLSTLHTNSAIDTLIRLKNMGMATFNITSSISLIIAQRLARRLCEKCKKPMQVPPQSLSELGFTHEEIAQATLFEPVGCHACQDGYKGRIGIYELLPITPAFAKLVMADSPTHELLNHAKSHGFHTLRDSAKNQVIQGVISIQEMERLTHA